MLTLKSQGLSPEEIAPRVGCSARTVRQWLADEVKTTPRRPGPLDTYASHLRRRWEEGEQLYQELLEKGNTGSVRAVYRYLNRWRSSRADRGEPVVRKHRPGKTAPPAGPFDEECQPLQGTRPSRERPLLLQVRSTSARLSKLSDSTSAPRRIEHEGAGTSGLHPAGSSYP